MPARKKIQNANGRPVWADISLSALTHNLRAIRDFVNPKSEKRATPRQVLCIVKGNGYGHGGPQVAKALEKAGADWFGVTGASEGEQIREAGVRKPILALTSFWRGEEAQLLANNISPAIIRCEQLAALDSAATKRKFAKHSAGFHLKIDTGMNRLGIAPTDIECFARQYEKSSRLKLEGVFTHFASSEVFDGPVAAQNRRQEESFYKAVERLRSLGVDPGIVHLANSAAIASRPETWADMVRPGAILYGYHPGYDPIERRVQAEKELPLRPVMSLRARIINIRNVPPGDGVGYGSKFLPARASKIAVVAAGYGDGIHRSLGNKGSVLVRSVLAPIVGIVSMDVTMIDVTDVPDVALGDVATFYGTDGEHVLPANLVARGIGTVTSDLLCAVSARVPRIYLA
ncbi:MAG TPA: alanine racemase [Candidatus Acidoferrum sp.]|jgi:alanine racemase|nr:alanine racemase [Candidatus Acidoferrum sp.]